MAKPEKELQKAPHVIDPILPTAPDGIFNAVEQSSIKTDLRSKLVTIGFADFAKLNASAESLESNRNATKQIIYSIEVLSSLNPSAVHACLDELMLIIRDNNGIVSASQDAFSRSQVFGTMPDVEPDGTRFDNTIRLLNMFYYYASYSKPMFDASVDVEYSVDLVAKKTTRQAIASYFNM